MLQLRHNERLINFSEREYDAHMRTLNDDRMEARFLHAIETVEELYELVRSSPTRDGDLLNDLGSALSKLADSYNGAVWCDLCNEYASSSVLSMDGGETWVCHRHPELWGNPDEQNVHSENDSSTTDEVPQASEPEAPEDSTAQRSLRHDIRSIGTIHGYVWLDDDVAIVMLKRDHPTFEDRPYATWRWRASVGLVLGHYDLTRREAWDDFYRRMIGEEQ